MKEKVTMSLVGGSYQGTIKATANTFNDRKAETYRVWVRAKDGRNNQTPESGESIGGQTFEVSAPIKPPPEPSL